jgi:hypothetical protein
MSLSPAPNCHHDRQNKDQTEESDDYKDPFDAFGDSLLGVVLVTEVNLEHVPNPLLVAFQHAYNPIVDDATAIQEYPLLLPLRHIFHTTSREAKTAPQPRVQVKLAGLKPQERLVAFQMPFGSLGHGRLYWIKTKIVAGRPA